MERVALVQATCPSAMNQEDSGGRDAPLYGRRDARHYERVVHGDRCAATRPKSASTLDRARSPGYTRRNFKIASLCPPHFPYLPRHTSRLRH